MVTQQAAKLSEQVYKIIHIIKHGKKEQVFFVIGVLFSAIPTIPPISSLLEQLSFPLKHYWFSVTGLIFISLGIYQVWKKVTPHETGELASPKPTAIKGPLSFGEHDGEIFTKLGRNKELGVLLDWSLDNRNKEKHFVALKGESGAGKTSLLRAGLWYTLKEKKDFDGIIPIYWEATPENADKDLLRVIQIACPDDNLNSLEDLLEASSQKKVIIVDQAEQLSLRDHKKLFDFFKAVTEQIPPYSITWIIAFRDEYATTWFDFEQSIPNFHPQKLSLKRFTKRQAETIMAEIAIASKMEAESKVIAEMVNAMAVDGTVSPVDIGIAMMVLSEIHSDSDAIISMIDFRGAGEVRGLLGTYIGNKFEEGIPKHEHSAVMTALLNLVDPEKPDQRLSSGKSIQEIYRVTRLTFNRLTVNFDYLASQSVRLLEQIPSRLEDSYSYRLTHERLIPALRHLTGSILAAAEQAKLLLNESYAIWARSKRFRYLLTMKELRKVLKHINQIYLGENKEHKQEFIRKSKKKRNFLYATNLLLLIGLVGFFYKDINLEALSLYVEIFKPSKFVNSIEMEFVTIKPGSFMMGSRLSPEQVAEKFGGEASWYRDERPQHEVQISRPFYIQTTEVTQKQWEAVMVTNRSQMKGNVDNPVESVSWDDAKEFIDRLNAKERTRKYRLPTEAEWEYAARAGTTTAFSFGDDIGKLKEYAWYRENSEKKTHPVRKKKPNDWGLYDMHGNVWEWVQDWYDDYHSDPVVDPKGPDTGADRVMRGGSWDGGAHFCRSADRVNYSPDYRFIDIGFRLARSVALDP
jgi:formylglycine-generating enzyme required for sulfatase activity